MEIEEYRKSLLRTFLVHTIIFTQKITRDEIKKFESLSTKRDSKGERHVRDPAFQTRKKKTMEECGGAERNKIGLAEIFDKTKDRETKVWYMRADDKEERWWRDRQN